MPFGKYKGAALSDIPETYLRWLLTLDLHNPLLAQIEDELDRREYERQQEYHRHHQSPPPPQPPVTAVDPVMVKRLIQVGFKRLAVDLHPDHGGSTSQMQSLVSARDWLSACAEAIR